MIKLIIDNPSVHKVDALIGRTYISIKAKAKDQPFELEKAEALKLKERLLLRHPSLKFKIVEGAAKDAAKDVAKEDAAKDVAKEDAVEDEPKKQGNNGQLDLGESKPTAKTKK